MDRKYTLAEIADMRKAIEMLTMRGSSNPAEESARVEDQLRTYMANGTDPEELQAAARKRFDGMLAAQRRGFVPA